MSADPRIKEAEAIIESDPDRSHALCNDVLKENPDDCAALVIVGVLLCKAARHGYAIPIFEKVARLHPTKAEGWNYAGMAWQECASPEPAREYFKRAFAIKRLAQYAANIAVTYMDEANYPEALKWCQRAQEINPAWTDSLATMGFAQLALGNWADGWKNYDRSLGGRFRKRLDFGAAAWDGSPVDSLIIYGEQGLGDEITYASIIEDAQRLAKRITLECDPRLESLFARSFPGIEVHGTRRQAQPWRAGRTWDAQIAIASLPVLFRPSMESCPRKPYLQADPERRLMWRALFDSYKKPVIGICWSGGTHATHSHRRLIGLETFRPLIESTNARFVSLQYKDAEAEISKTGLPVRQFHEVLSDNYDDTASMVAELDYIVGPATAVHHLAGALGKPSLLLVQEKALWCVAVGDGLPWNEDQKYLRQKRGESWADVIKKIDLTQILESYESTPGVHRLGDSRSHKDSNLAVA